MTKIGVICNPSDRECLQTLKTLGEAIGIEIVENDIKQIRSFDGYIHVNASRNSIDEAASRSVPTFLVACEDHYAPNDCSSSTLVSFSSLAPFPFAGRKVLADDASSIRGLPAWVEGFLPVAEINSEAIWSVSSKKNPLIWLSSAPIPILAEEGSLFDYFSGNRFIALLPLLSFVNLVTKAHEWNRGALTACFMFDDPNIHWPKYGYIDFSELARNARRNNYHVASATIPIDAWFVHAQTARLFRENRDYISLLVHGNDHVQEELGRQLADAEREAIVAQSLHRIRRLEGRAGLDVSKTMAPPHGACTESMLSTMKKFGFESACISRGSLRHFNPGSSWLSIIGMNPADEIGGLTVIPRFRMSRTCQNDILIAAFLGQPIIPVGHHDDLANGLTLLEELASFINSLGEVSWGNLTDIVNTIHTLRVDGTNLEVCMTSRQARIAVPDGVSSVSVSQPANRTESVQPEVVTMHTSDGAKVINEICNKSATALEARVRPGQQLLISIYPNEGALDPRYVKRRPPLVWPIVRRLLTESRDRLMPIYRPARGKP